MILNSRTFQPGQPYSLILGSPPLQDVKTIEIHERDEHRIQIHEGNHHQLEVLDPTIKYQTQQVFIASGTDDGDEGT